ncbi:MAG: PAS domain-containing sensor histidine kinase [Anaerolineales bacterium]
MEHEMELEQVSLADRERELTDRTILEDAADGIVVIGEFAQILEWNPAQVRITGITRQQALGEPLFDVLFRLTPPEHRTIAGYIETKEHISDFLLHGEQAALASPIESEIVRADGSRRVVESRHFRIQGGGAPRAGCITRDISARKRLENDQLEVVKMKEEFVSKVSHSLRGPLQGLLGNLDTLKSEVPLSEDERALALDQAIRAANRLASLVVGLTMTTGLKAGVELKIEEVDLKRIIEDAVGSLSELAARKGVPLAYAPEADLRPVQADRPRLLQVLHGLIGNAIRASGAGSPVLVTSAAQNGEVTIQVIDHGPGIAFGAEPELFSQVLMPGEEGPGTGGPGLYLLRKIVEAHGGQMGVQSQLGVGSTFYFSLPAAGAQ